MAEHTNDKSDRVAVGTVLLVKRVFSFALIHFLVPIIVQAGCIVTSVLVSWSTDADFVEYLVALVFWVALRDAVA